MLPVSCSVLLLLPLLSVDVAVQARLGQHLLRGALRLPRPGVPEGAPQLQTLLSNLVARVI